MKINDEIRAFVNNLYDAGARGNSNAYKGMRVCDEEHLAALLMQATPFNLLPSIHDLDRHDSIYGMVGRFIKNESPECAEDIAQYLKNIFVNYYQETIQQLMDDVHAVSRDGQQEQREAAEETRRNIAAFDRQRI